MKAILWRCILAVGCQLSAANWVLACPRCLQATPYKSGLLWAVLFLLPIPFILAGLVVAWVVRRSKTGFPPF